MARSASTSTANPALLPLSMWCVSCRTNGTHSCTRLPHGLFQGSATLSHPTHTAILCDLKFVTALGTVCRCCTWLYYLQKTATKCPIASIRQHAPLYYTHISVNLVATVPSPITIGAAGLELEPRVKAPNLQPQVLQVFIYTRPPLAAHGHQLLVNLGRCVVALLGGVPRRLGRMVFHGLCVALHSKQRQEVELVV